MERYKDKTKMKSSAHFLDFKTDMDLLFINALGIILIVFISLTSISFIRILLAIPFILFFPGYSLVSALFPRNKELEGVERIFLSLGLSIGVVSLLGFALNYTPFGIRLYPVLFSLYAFTFFLSVVTAFRRKKLNFGEKFVPTFWINIFGGIERNRTKKYLFLGFLIFVFVSGAFLSYFVSLPRIGEKFTEFYIMGLGGKVEDYPTNLTLGENSTLILGIVNQEYKDVNYKISVVLDGYILFNIENILLMHKERWEQNCTFMPHKIGNKIKLEFLLFMDEKINPHRSLQLWVKVNPV